MAKLLHQVIYSCDDCPHFEEPKQRQGHCAAPNRFTKVNPREIPADCPLPDTAGDLAPVADPKRP